MGISLLKEKLQSRLESHQAVQRTLCFTLQKISVVMCYMNGFVEFTRKMRIDFKSFECDAVGTLEKVRKSFEVTKIDMKARVVIGSEDIRKKIERALELAAKYCYVGNSMKCAISHDTHVIIE